MFRTLAVAALALVAGLGIGLANGAGADQPKAAATVSTKTPTSCLLALESAWKAINQTPTGTDNKAEFDTHYAEFLQES